MFVYVYVYLQRNMHIYIYVYMHISYIQTHHFYKRDTAALDSVPHTYTHTHTHTHLIPTHISSTILDAQFIFMFFFTQDMRYIYMIHIYEMQVLETKCVYMCVYVCVYTYTYTHTYIHTYPHTLLVTVARDQVSLSEFGATKHIYMYIYIFAYLCTYTYVYIYMYAHPLFFFFVIAAGDQVSRVEVG